MRVAQVSCWIEPQQRSPAMLLEAWPTLVDVAAATARAGVAVTVVQAAHTDEVIEHDGVQFRFTAAPAPSALQRRCGTWSWPLPATVANAVASIRPDIVHLHGLSFPRHARFLKKAANGARLLVQDHADHPPPKWRAAIHKHGLVHADAVVFTAEAQALPFEPLLRTGVDVFAIPESSSRFTPGDRDAARRTTGLNGDPCLLWVGHLDANKDPLTILDALARTAEALPGAQLWMAYLKAPLLDAVRQRIGTDASMAQRVHLLGERSHAQIESLMRSADFLVQGSRSEGSGYAVIEALACGTVPLVTDIPSFRSLTDDGRFGGLSPVGDGAAMAATWIDWARRDREAIRADARRHFARHLSFDAVGMRLRDAYDRMLRG